MKIHLTDMEFFAFHGVFPQEQQNGNTFLVNIIVEMPMPKACQTDELDDALNYQLIYDVVAEEMSTPSKLLEHVAARIKSSLIAKFPIIISLMVRVSKKNPPLGGSVPWVSVEL